jgi:adenine-specific DNA-methyltransferase
MAKIEDLIAQVPDERLRKAIAGEVKALKKTKKFGLVFEEHLPETLRLPRLPVREGEVVALKREPGNQLWRVKSIRKDIAICEKEVEAFPPLREPGRDFPISNLVVVRNFGDPIYPALIPVDRVQRGGPDKPWHVLINADNFHALQLLLYCYEGKVDVIYIDPPYNTGARDWKYNNDYVDKTDTFRHSKWLSMMKKRLRLAKQLLKPDGVLIVTIDEHEVHHLGNLLEDELREYARPHCRPATGLPEPRAPRAAARPAAR